MNPQRRKHRRKRRRLRLLLNQPRKALGDARAPRGRRGHRRHNSTQRRALLLALGLGRLERRTYCRRKGAKRLGIRCVAQQRTRKLLGAPPRRGTRRHGGGKQRLLETRKQRTAAHLHRTTQRCCCRQCHVRRAEQHLVQRRKHMGIEVRLGHIHAQIGVKPVQHTCRHRTLGTHDMRRVVLQNTLLCRSGKRAANTALYALGRLAADAQMQAYVKQQALKYHAAQARHTLHRKRHIQHERHV